MSGNNGGPAFPVNELDQATEKVWSQHMGRTLRDYFAAKALPVASKVFEDGHPNGWEGIAIAAYSIADAMIAARETK